MNKKIYLYALVSAPLLALYAASPFYIFGVIGMQESVNLFLWVLVSVVFYWIINSVMFLHLEKKQTVGTLLLSYFITFCSNVLKAPFESFVDFRDMVQEYIFFPITTTLALNTIILLLINAIISERKRQQADLTISELQVQKLQAENGMLLQQLQPHFLFNALSVLKSLITEDAQVAEQYSVKLSEFLRYSVDSHTSELVPIREEMQFVHTYLDLQKIRFEHAFDFEVQLPEEIYSSQVPVFAIQGLVENAFKHNYFTEKRPLHILISQNEDSIIVENNIVSLKLTERAGTGLTNLDKRSQFLAGKGIEVQQSETNFRVTLPIIAA